MRVALRVYGTTRLRGFGAAPSFPDSTMAAEAANAPGATLDAVAAYFAGSGPTPTLAQVAGYAAYRYQSVAVDAAKGDAGTGAPGLNSTSAAPFLATYFQVYQAAHYGAPPGVAPPDPVALLQELSVADAQVVSLGGLAPAGAASSSWTGVWLPILGATVVLAGGAAVVWAATRKSRHSTYERSR